MAITLREVTRENYEDICELEVADDQKRHLSSNIESLLESKYYDTLVPRGIYYGDEPVGFIMGERTSESKVEIFRFMIDIDYQKKGYGRAALEVAIAEIRQLEGVSEIQICYHPDNEVAKQLYFKLGFKEVGMDEAGEDMLAVLSV
ncbi:MAG: GNAT family N-acetyltransferase [Acidiferrobacterales bacterium]|nr:GNAT family N-acetyltransferase [Acidiferrobacterales bacterium]